MGLFERFRKNEQKSNAVSEQWDMQNVQFAGEQQPSDGITPNERQQQKIIAFLNGRTEALRENKIVLQDGEKQKFYDKLTNGTIGLEDQKRLLDSIAGPKHQYGPMAVYTGLAQDRNGQPKAIKGVFDREHIMKLTAVFSGRGYEKYKEVEAVDVREFWDRFETPADFEPEAQRFLEIIKQNNSPRKYQEYQGHMREFQRTMFGKQQEYWEQMQLLEKEAKRFDRANQTVKLMGETAITMGEMDPIIKSVGLAAVSKVQVAQGIGEIDRLVDDGSSQDAALMMPEKGIFGVFDGVGGKTGGRLASNIAAEEVARLSNEKEAKNSVELGDMLNSASELINNTPEAGASTGTLIKIAEVNGNKLLMWTSVGDSRVYVVNNRNQARLISKDEGYENKITNALGGGLEGKRVRQAGTVDLHDGDRVVLCTDGITGDKEPELMSAEELGLIVGQANTADLAAKDLARMARKQDDRTAIVVQI